MLSWLKKHFIPHEGNNDRPHILRENTTRNIVILVLFVEIFTFLLPTLIHINRTGGMAAVLPAILADLTNKERESQNLNTLKINPILVHAAEMKAEDMATKGYFAHTSPEGKTPWYWIEQAGYKYQYAGENLAMNFSDSKDVTNAWMASPTHRANIVKDKYTEVGTGVAYGLYEGKETTFVAQVYANPLNETKFNNAKPASDKSIKPISLSNTPIKQIPATSNVLGMEVNTQQTKSITTENNIVPKISFLQKIYSSPRNTNKVIMNIIFTAITISLLLYIVIKRKNHHIDLITNGLVVIAVVGVIISTNYYMSYRNMVTTQSIDYSYEIK